MVALFLTTTISCSNVIGIVSRITRTVGLTYQQRVELIKVIQQTIPSCPIIVKPDEHKRTSGN